MIGILQITHYKYADNSFFLMLSFCSCSLILWNTTNDNKSEWWLSMSNCISSWKVIPRPSPVCDGPPNWPGICCTVLWHLVSSATQQSDPRWRPHFLHPAANAASTLHNVYGYSYQYLLFKRWCDTPVLRLLEPNWRAVYMSLWCGGGACAVAVFHHCQFFITVNP